MKSFVVCLLLGLFSFLTGTAPAASNRQGSVDRLQNSEVLKAAIVHD
jgi:hypothetical protein